MLGGNEKMYDLNSVKAVIFNRNAPLKSFDALDKQVADMVKEEVEKYYVTPGGNVMLPSLISYGGTTIS